MNLKVLILILMISLTLSLPIKDAHRTGRKDKGNHQSVSDSQKITDDDNRMITKVDTKPTKLSGYEDVMDKHRHRQKRFKLLQSKWQKRLAEGKTTLYWAFDNSHPHYKSEAIKIREVIAEALRIWSTSSMLNFIEVEDLSKADMLISFQPEHHLKIDPYTMAGTLGHAFPPASGIGGDIHIRDDQAWHFDLNTTTPSGRKNFFAVILHEIGHALGLDHSEIPEAVMFESYPVGTRTLHVDDIGGIEHIYGKRNERTKQPPVDDFPEKCYTDVDAVASIKKERFFFKNKYMWSTRTFKEPSMIRDTFTGLPNYMRRVDAVYEAYNDRKIWFFMGREIYIFEEARLIERKTLSDIGIDQQKYRKIDAIFRFNNREYIFSGEVYWRLEKTYNSNLQVEKGYPKDRKAVWKNVYDIDTAFSEDGQLNFFEGLYAYKFDPEKMSGDRMNLKNIASFMDCKNIKSTIPNDKGKAHDVVHEYKQDEIEKDLDNPEKIIPTTETEEDDDRPSMGTSIVNNYVVVLALFILFLAL